jgi:hypothetical protein
MYATKEGLIKDGQAVRSDDRPLAREVGFTETDIGGFCEILRQRASRSILKIARKRPLDVGGANRKKRKKGGVDATGEVISSDGRS